MKGYKVPKFFQKMVATAFGEKDRLTVKEFNLKLNQHFRFNKPMLKALRSDLVRSGAVSEYNGKLYSSPSYTMRFEGVSFNLGKGVGGVRKEMDGKKKGVVEFIPLAIGLVIAIIVIVSVGVPIVNSATYISSSYTGATKSILENILPLFAVSAIALVAVGLMRMFS